MKYVFTTLLLLMFLSYGRHCFAQQLSFTKYANNPITISTLQNITEESVFHPFVLFENGQFKLWYTSKDQIGYGIGYATSDDGTHWQYQTTIRFSQLQGIHNPTILKKDGKYYLYVMGLKDDLYFNGIYREESSDGIHFNENSFIQVYSPQNDWEKNHLASPFVLFEHNTYYLFYAAEYAGMWSASLATSSDGIHFTPCSNNPKGYFADGPIIISHNRKKYFFFHYVYTIGIKYLELPDTIDCNTPFDIEHGTVAVAPNMPYDQDHITNPAPVEVNGALYIYYNALGEGKWRFHLTTTGPLYSPSPTPTPKIPIVFIPGMFASWNHDAMVHKKEVAITDWKLLPFTKEMGGLYGTFHNLGYEDNKTIFFRYYDWRQSVEKTVGQLHEYLQTEIWSKNPSQQIDLVGHSLGGIIARIYVQKYGTTNIHSLVTIGSPHQGTALVYKLLEAGVIEGNYDWQWLGMHTALQLYRNGIDTNTKIIQTNIPSLYDIAPIQPFLTDNKAMIDPSSSHIQNVLLLKYDQTLTTIFPILTTIYGNSKDTVAGYRVEKRNTIQETLDLYPDGNPVESLQTYGDGTITMTSAKAGNTYFPTQLNHTELIYKKSGIETLLNALHIYHQSSDIVEGNKTNLLHAYIIIGKSPILLQAFGNNTTYSETDGILFIDNPADTPYTITATGTDFGDYHIEIGRIDEQTVTWNEMSGTISTDPPTAQKDLYTISYLQNNVPSATPEPTIQSITVTPPIANITIVSAPTITKTVTPTVTLTPTKVIQKEYIIPNSPVPSKTPSQVLGIQENFPTPTPKIYITIESQNIPIHPSIIIVSILILVLSILIWIVKRGKKVERLKPMYDRYARLSDWMVQDYI